MVTNLIVQIWMDIDPVEGESRWYDPTSGWETNDRRKAVSWVRLNQVGLPTTGNLTKEESCV